MAGKGDPMGDRCGVVTLVNDTEPRSNLVWGYVSHAGGNNSSKLLKDNGDLGCEALNDSEVRTTSNN